MRRLFIQVILGVAALLAVSAGARSQTSPANADQQIAEALERLKSQLRGDDSCWAKQTPSNSLFPSLRTAPRPAVPRVYIAGFAPTGPELSREQRAWLLEATHREANRKGFSASLPDDYDMVQTLLQDGRGDVAAVRGVWDKMSAGRAMDLVLLIQVLHVSSEGHRISLAAYGLIGAVGCQKRESIDRLALPKASLQRPQALMEGAARKLLSKHPSPGIVAIDKTRIGNAAINTECATLLESKLNNALHQVFNGRITFGDAHRLRMSRMGAQPAKPDDQTSSWIGQIVLSPSASGYHMNVMITSLDGEQFADSGMVSPDALDCRSLSQTDSPIEIAALKASYKVNEEITFELNLKQQLYLYCMLEDPVQKETQIVLPDPTRTLAAHHPTRRLILDGASFGLKDPIVSDRAGIMSLHCFASPQRLPQAMHDTWMKHHVVEGLRRIEAERIPLTDKRAESYLLVPGDTAQDLIRALRSRRAHEARVDVRVEK